MTPSDSDVDEAISSMAQERKRLIKEGKLKREGKINKTADTEIEIPSTWRLIPLRELVCKRVDNRGKTPPHSLIKNPNECIDLLEIASIIPGKSIDHNKVEKYVTEETYNQQRGFIEKDDILIATVGSIGKFALMDDTKSAVAQNIIAIKCFDLVEQHYIFYLLQSPYFYSAMGCIKMEAVQASIKVPDLMNLNVPLPPIEEQRRIVAKIEELLPFVDRYAASYEKLEQLNIKFPEDMKKSILQYAIQGKLVEQRPEEGTAESEIKVAEALKDKLNSDGILKGRKTKELHPIGSDIPFDLPDSWRWVRLGDLVEIFGRIGFRGYTKNDIVNKGEGAITMSPSNINQLTGAIDFSNSTYLSWEKYEESPEIMLAKGDIVLVKTGSSYGKCGIIQELPEKATINPQLAILKYISCDNNYLNWALKSPCAKSQYEQFVTGTSIPTFSQEKLANMFIPLPPLAEQHRIVAKIEELLPYCDQLIK